MGGSKRGDGGDAVIVAAVIILLPMFLGAFLLVGAATLDAQRHAAIKIFLFLLSIMTFFSSMHLGILSAVEYYPTFTSLQDWIGQTTWWVGMCYVLIITYFIMYLVYQAIHTAAQKKQEELQY